MATVIGLCLRVKLMRTLPSQYKVYHVAVSKLAYGMFLIEFLSYRGNDSDVAYLSI